MSQVWFRLHCYRVRVRLSAYLHGELKPSGRRFVARHLDRCPHCRHVYQQQRELVRDLERDLPAFGAPSSATMRRLWGNIAAERPTATTQPTLLHSLSYGFAALMLVLLLVLPLTIGAHHSHEATVPVQPDPQQRALIMTPIPARMTKTPTAIALVNTRPVDAETAVPLHNTPEAKSHQQS